MPYTDCVFDELAEDAERLPATVALPMVLELIVVVPVTAPLLMPYRFDARVPPVFAAVTEAIRLLRQSTVPVEEIFMPYSTAPVVDDVTVTDPVPVAEPIVLPVTVPMFMSPAAAAIAVHVAFALFDQLKFLTVLSCTEVGEAVPAVMLIALKVLLKAAVFVQGDPPHEAACPPIKLPLIVNPTPDALFIRIALYVTDPVGTNDAVS